MNRRLATLLTLLAATLAGGWWLGENDDAVPAPVEVAARGGAPAQVRAQPPAAPRAAVMPAVARDEGLGGRFPVGGADLFAPVSWRLPPPPAPEPPPPPPPMAPPLPYQYLGRWQDDTGTTVFLRQGDRMLAAREGQAMDPWQLDRVEAAELKFTYLPLQQQRSLRLTP